MKRFPPGHRLRLFSGFYLLPLIFVIAWTVGMNGALAHGVPKQDLLPGWPILIAVHAVWVAVIVWLGRQRLLSLTRVPHS